MPTHGEWACCAAIGRARDALCAGDVDFVITRDGIGAFDDAVARELLAGYVEELAAWAVGADAAPELLRCWGSG